MNDDATLMTSEYDEHWSRLGNKWHLVRLREWAEMLEARVAQLDPDYRAYPWGLTPPPTEWPPCLKTLTLSTPTTG